MIIYNISVSGPPVFFTELKVPFKAIHQLQLSTVSNRPTMTLDTDGNVAGEAQFSSESSPINVSVYFNAWDWPKTVAIMTIRKKGGSPRGSQDRAAEKIIEWWKQNFIELSTRVKTFELF